MNTTTSAALGDVESDDHTMDSTDDTAADPVADPAARNAVDDALLNPEPQRDRLSWRRLAIVVAVVAGLAAFAVVRIDDARSNDRPIAKSWSVPYVDVTLTPSYEFQNPESNPARDIALAFVVADPQDRCVPSWGGAYTLDEASRDLELDRRITQLRAAGGDVMISFGGQANDELAFVCTDVDDLTAAYGKVVDRYDAEVIDLDIENADIADAPSIERRAKAIATVQRERIAAGGDLAVWITLPVTTNGLTADGIALVAATIAGGVDVAGVNIMTMNFNSSQPTADMLGATKSALEASAVQVADIYRDQGMTLDGAQRWARLGATPMIGQNDVEGEVFTLDDARGLATFAINKGLGRVSTWSLNRDRSCGAAFVDVMVLSNTCSSLAQGDLEFAGVFSGLRGRSPNQTGDAAVVVIDQPLVVDDPTTSPYPIWRPEAQYPQGYKVVRGGQVYQAKWYTQGQEPSIAPVVNGAEPWSLVGPVDPDDEPFAPTTLAPGTHPDWSPVPLYATGDSILFGGLPYEARWPNKAQVPSALFPVGPDSAWQPLFSIPGEPPDP